MSETDVRTAIAAERALTLARLARLRTDFEGVIDASRDSNADDEHDPEGQTIAFERSQTGSLIQRALDQLAELDAAERRIDAGSYGTCATCGRVIDTARLKARPRASHCLTCASTARPLRG